MAYDFDGANDKIEYSTNPLDDVGKDLVISAWYEYDAATGYMVGRWLSNAGWFLRRRSSSNIIQFGIANGDFTTNSIVSSSAPATTWGHILINYSHSGTSELFFNGTSEATKNLANTITEPSTPFVIGNRADDLRDWDGRVAEFAMWQNVTLTTAEVTALADGLSARFIRPDSLGTYIPLRRDSTDWITGNTTGTVTGATVFDHPRIIYPGQVFYSIPTAVGINQTVNPATVPIVGATVGFTLTIDQTVSPGTLPINGQSVGFDLTIDQTVSPGTLPINGQTVGFGLGAGINQTVVPGTLPIVGATVAMTLDIDQVVSPGTLPISGQSVTYGMTVDQTVSAGTLPITGQNVGLTISGALTHVVQPGTLTITGQTLTQHLKSTEGFLLAIIEDDLGLTFFECSGQGFASEFVHASTTYCGIFTAEAKDIAERQNPFLETETSNTTAMSRGDVIEVLPTPLNAGGTFTIRGLSPDGTGQTMIILDTP